MTDPVIDFAIARYQSMYCFVGGNKKTSMEAIALHSKVITNVCNRIGIERTTRQNFIRTARDNGKKLGLLA